MSYRSVVLGTPGLVGYWPLNEPSGTTANDLFGSNDGTTSGATPGATGIVTNTGDTAYSFDGTDDVVTIGTHAEFDTDHVSVECWFVQTGSWADSAPLVAYRVASGGAGGWVFQSAGTPGQYNWYLVPGGAGFINLLTTGWDADTVWHMVATYDGHRHRVYRNGVLLDTYGSDFADVLAQPADLVLSIGKAANASPVHSGSIADVAVYDVALDASTVLAHYEAGAAVPDDGATTRRIRRQFQLRPY